MKCASNISKGIRKQGILKRQCLHFQCFLLLRTYTFWYLVFDETSLNIWAGGCSEYHPVNGYSTAQTEQFLMKYEYKYKNIRIKNDLEFQIGRYQSRATCFDIILTEALAEVWVSFDLEREVTLILFSLNIDNKMHFVSNSIDFWRLTHLYAIHTLD